MDPITLKNKGDRVKLVAEHAVIAAAVDDVTDAPVALKAHRDGSLKTSPGSLPYGADYAAYTYVAAGAADNDDVATITYKRGGSGGTTVATETRTYVGSTNNVATITVVLA